MTRTAKQITSTIRMSSTPSISPQSSFSSDSNAELDKASTSDSSELTKDNSSHNKVNIKLLFAVLMFLQNSNTLLGRYTRTSVEPSDLYEINHFIFMTELAKLVMSAMLEQYTTGQLMSNLSEHMLCWDCLKILVPALLYLVQNSMLFVALSHLSVPLFQFTYQSRLVTTAVLSVVMLQRRYSVQQWICLVVLSVGVSIVVLDNTSSSTSTTQSTHSTPSSLLTGLIAITMACLSCSLAGVYFEKVLKNNTSSSSQAAQPSLWMRNFQLALFSVVIAALHGLHSNAQNTSEESQPYFHGFSHWVWILVALQAGAGLLVAAVIKHADNVLKGLATGVSAVLGTICSSVLFGTSITLNFVGGAAMILGSVYVFSNPISTSSCRMSSSDGKKLSSSDDKPLLPQ